MTFPIVKAEGLHSAAPAEDYKTLRMREWAGIIEDEYPSLAPYKITLLAHLAQECGALSEDCGWIVGSPKSDYGWAIGIAQWHIPHRYPDWMKKRGIKYTREPKAVAAMRELFYADHPEMLNHFNQLRKYLGEMQSCYDKRKDIPTCIRRWNPGDAGYYDNVHSRRSTVLAYLD